MSYAQGVLAFLAALLPILASLYAGASFLREQYLLRWERRTRNRIKRLGRERLAGAEARASVRSKRLGVHVSEYDEVAAFETLMLAAHGLSRPTVTHSDVDLTHSMSATAASPGEIRRQAVLLLGATLGLSILGIDSI